MVLGFRGGGATGGSSVLLRRWRQRRDRVRRRGVRGAGWLSRGHGFARRRRRDRRFRGVGSCGGRVFRWVIRRSRDGWSSSRRAPSRRERRFGGRRRVVIFGRFVGLRLRKLDGSPVNAAIWSAGLTRLRRRRRGEGSRVPGCEISTGSPVNAAIWSAGLTRRSGPRGRGAEGAGSAMETGPLIGEK